jgi:hypothetical protein
MIQLQTTVNFASAMVNYLSLSSGPNNEPAITIGNIVKGVVLSPPFKWAWNRNKVIFQLQVGVQDYKISVPDFGFLETATFQPSAAITQVSRTGGTATYTAANNFKQGALVSASGLQTPGFNVTNQPITAVTPTTFSIALAGTTAATADVGLATSGSIKTFSTIRNNDPIGESSDVQQPVSLAVQSNDGQGNITFRVLGVPNGSYNVICTYQSAASSFTTLSSTWSPIPDYMVYIFTRGFTAHALEYKGDPRSAQEKVAFAAALLANAEGLDETQKNVFMSQYLANPMQSQSASLRVQQGTQARSQQ